MNHLISKDIESFLLKTYFQPFEFPLLRLVCKKWNNLLKKYIFKKDYITSIILLGYLNILKYIHEELKYPFEQTEIIDASFCNHVAIVKYLYKRGCLLSWKVSCGVCKNNNFEFLQWLVENNCEIWNDALNYGIENNNLMIVKYLRNLGVNYHEYSVMKATTLKDTSILEFMYHDIDIIEEDDWKYAILNKNLEALKWFKDKNFKFKDACFFSNQFNCYEVRNWLKENCCDCTGVYH